MELRNLFFFVLFLSFFLACKDEEGNQAAEKEIKSVASKLKENSATEAFVFALEKMSIKEFSSDAYTVFAIMDDALSPVRTESAIPIQEISPDLLKRHIVQGAFSLDRLKKTEKIASLNGEDLLVSVSSSGIIRINGVELPIPSQASKSYVYVIDKVIPEKEPKKENVSFKVFSCNENFSENNPSQGFPVDGATVKIYNQQNKLVETLITNAQGEASFERYFQNEYIYHVEKGGAKNLYRGWKIEGLFTSNDELRVYPEYRVEELSSQRFVGGLKLLDLNGDAIIDNQDKLAMGAPIPIETQTAPLNVYIASESFMPIIKPEELTQELLESYIKKFNVAFSYYLITDKELSTIEDRRSLTIYDERLKNLWEKSYSVIAAANNLLLLEAKHPEYKAVVRKYRAAAYVMLTVPFGDIPLVLTTNVEEIVKLKRTKVADIYKFALQELNEVVNLVPGVDNELQMLIGLISMRNRDYNNAIFNFTKIEDKGLTEEDFSFVFVMNLLMSEAQAEQGQTKMAIDRINVVYQMLDKNSPVSPSSSLNEIKIAIRETYLLKDSGMNNFNTQRWGLDGDWGKYALMPIPQKEIDINPGITQNPGW